MVLVRHRSIPSHSRSQWAHYLSLAHMHFMSFIPVLPIGRELRIVLWINLMRVVLVLSLAILRDNIDVEHLVGTHLNDVHLLACLSNN